MKVINMGNIAEAYTCDDLPAMGIVIEATLDELERLPNLVYKEVAISAMPRRNCDVGTAKEQAKRLNEWCNGRHCVTCRFKGGWPDECKLKWAQMPYEEGDNK